ncbi:hypothetical protein MD588_25250 [Photobacterium sp. SDRW27]|uniref:hypothetical protein n=1 Tax=Photobacterium obscurum TaxID=2829490 RepID=UPI0022441F11|nr:hypothetical protein [Photobacterium obscurum]MCW8332103.1 hypothetical protein [Photobacterium obscurum]
MNLCINFFVDGPSAGKKETATDEQTRRQLATLLGDIAQETKNIIIDFSLNDTRTLTQYGSFREAWQRLDISQREFIAAFRHLLGKAFLNPHSYRFDEMFFCDLVRDRFNQHASNAMAEEGMKTLPCNLQVLFASRAHKETVDQVGAHNEVPSYKVINK